MNDPGLDEPISNDANDVENQKADEQNERKENEQAFLEPSRWWFASTAFPLIAGTFGPMASAFSICALVVKWRMEIPPGKTEEDGIMIQDPKWLVGINATQLVIALISNISLLMNMAHRIRFSIAQPVTIIGWYLSSFALIGLLACAAGPLKLEPTETHAFTQAYYYGIFAAGLYFIVATLMVITVWGAYRGHYEKEFQLTMSQRTLMLQTILYFVYLLLGALVFSYVEDWKFLDAVYWANFTLLTVGIGDFTPSTHAGRSILFPFAIGGIIILGLVIGSIRSLVLERGKEKMSERMVEKERRRLLKNMEKHNKSEVLEPITPQSATSSGIDERERRKKEFELMRRIQDVAMTKRRWNSLIISAITWFILWFVGAAIFQTAEYSQKWTYFTSLYFSYTSLLTIGYGDFYPTSNAGKPFFVFWSLLAVPSLTILISNMGDTIVKFIKDFTLWVGTLTVLPGEHGVRAALKENSHRISHRKLFAERNEDNGEPAGILGETDRREGEVDPESAHQQVQQDRATRNTKAAGGHEKHHDELPASKVHYHYLLIQEISNVTTHLKSTPPRKYTFDEWAWYLKLMQEDEGSSEKHRKALTRPKKDEGLDEDVGVGDLEWSWVGNRSPLMGGQAEAEWVLERLVGTLEKELEVARRQHEENGHGEMDKYQREQRGIGNDQTKNKAQAGLELKHLQRGESVDN